jgi:hypothetical protein
LGNYASRVDPGAVRPSRGYPKAHANSASIATNIPMSSKLPTNSASSVDAPLDSGSDNDSVEGENDAEGDMEDYLGAEEMFADD